METHQRLVIPGLVDPVIPRLYWIHCQDHPARAPHRDHEWNGKDVQGGLAPQEPRGGKGELARRLQGHQSSGLSPSATAL